MFYKSVLVKEMGIVVTVVSAIVTGALAFIGFSSVGPVAGSIAAGIQSAVYGGAVVKGSLFAACQAAAMAL